MPGAAHEAVVRPLRMGGNAADAVRSACPKGKNADYDCKKI